MSKPQRPVVKRGLGIILGFAALAVVAATVAQQAGTAVLEGRVVDEQGRALAGVQVCAVRRLTLDRLPDDRPATAGEATLTTDAEGRFKLEVPAATPGLDAVVLFTLAAGRQNVILPATPYPGDAPTVAMLKAAGVQSYDLTALAEPVAVVLKPGAAAAAGSRVETYMVPMRDGTRLATDVAFPAGDGPWPAVVIRTPYGREGKVQTMGWPAMGIVAVLQDVRGRFGSEGGNFAFRYDGWSAEQDGVDTIAWVAAQPWCNGKIGSEGASAGGITQVLTAAAQPEALDCQAIGVAFSSMYHHACYVGGAFQKSLIEGWLESNKFDPQNLADVRAHETYDAYWSAYDAGARAARVTVPGLFTGGWYDVFQQGTIDAFNERQERGGPGAKGRQKLVIGPWPHGRKREVGEVVMPENALRPPGPTSGAWMRHHLLGDDNGVDDLPAVTYYQMGALGEPAAPGNVWMTADSWPPASTSQAWYLQPDETLSLSEPPAGGASKRYDYDPANPVPTRGGHNLTIPSGPFDQRPVEKRPDVLVFTTAPLEQPVAIGGRVTARIWFASSARDTDLTVKLTDVYPDGRSMLMLDGIRRLKFRNGYTKPEPLEPGQPYEIEVDLWSTSLVFNKGHRIRVAISSSNAPRFEPHSNTFEPLNQRSRSEVAHQTVFLDAARPSRLILPLVALD